MPRLSFAALGLLACLPVIAEADVSSSQLPEIWQDLADQRGHKLALTQTDSGLSLVLRLPTETGHVILRAKSIQLKDRADGAVIVHLPETAELDIFHQSQTAPIGTGRILTENGQLIVTENAQGLTHLFQIDTLRYLTEFIDDRDPDLVIPAALTLNAIKGAAQQIQGNSRFKANAANAEWSIQSRPENGTAGSFTGQAEAPKIQASFANSKNLAFLQSLQVATSETNAVLSITERGQNTKAKISVGNSNLDMKISGKDRKVSSAAEDTEVSVSSNQIPFPVNLTFGEINSASVLPAYPTSAPLPFTSQLAVSDLSLAPANWQVIDPNRYISRDPAQLQVAITGEGVASKMAVPGPFSQFGFEATRAKIEDFQFDFAGMSLSADGSLRFVPHQRIPQPPTGKLILDVQGLPQFLNAIAAAGLVPQSQLTLLQFGLSSFLEQTRDGGLRAVFAFGEGGSMRLNGMPLR